MNSATEELNAARVRGCVELGINGSWWLGTTIGALGSIVLLNPHLFGVDVGWRIAFGLGAVLGVGVLLIRRLLPPFCSRSRDGCSRRTSSPRGP